MNSPIDFDLAVVGGGLGGLAAASLAQRLGMKVALLEAHSRLGGCAGYFPRGPFTFDAGATALMGLDPRQPVGALIDVVGLELEATVTPAYRVHLPDRTLDIVSNSTEFEAASAAAFPDLRAQGRFWRLQEMVGRLLFDVAGQVPRLPLRSFSDVCHNLGILGIRGLGAGVLSLITVQDVLKLMGLHQDRAFRFLISMLLQDTAQAGPEIVPFANAAACLQAYRNGMSRPKGGMQALVSGLGTRFAQLGGDLQTSTIVDRIKRVEDHRFELTTRRRRRLRARQVVLNLPLDRGAALLGWPLEGAVEKRHRRSKATWSAFTGYVAISRKGVPDDTPLFHQVLQSYEQPIHDGNNVLVSLSAVEDEGYGPPDTRVATLSTHVKPLEWLGMDRRSLEARKVEFQDRMVRALRRALPDAPDQLVHAEFATPRSFQRYTRRTEGRVGGAPVSRWNSNLLAVGSDAFGPGVWVVGDSVFPGQGTMATVLSGIRVIEQVSKMSWDEIQKTFGSSGTRSFLLDSRI